MRSSDRSSTPRPCSASTVAHDLGHRRRGEAEDLAALDDRDRAVVGEHLGAEVGEARRAAARNVQLVPLAAVGVHPEAEETPPVLRRVGFEDEGAGAVAEDDGPVAVRRAPGERLRPHRALGLAEHHPPLLLAPGKERGMALGADEEHPPGRARADEGVADLESGQKAGALHPDVERRSRRQAEAPRQDPAVSGEVVVGSHGRENDEVEIFGGETGVRDCPPRRLEAEDRRGLAAAGEAALLDAGPLADPIVRRIHQPREARIGDDALRHEHAGASDDGCREGHAGDCNGLPEGGRRGGSQSTAARSTSPVTSSIAAVQA